MTNRELIKQLLDEDLDAEVVIEASHQEPVLVQGIGFGVGTGGNRVILVPEGRLVVE